MSDGERAGGCKSDLEPVVVCQTLVPVVVCQTARESVAVCRALEPVVVCRDLWLVCGIRHGSTLHQLLPLLNSEERRRGPTARGAEQVAGGRGNWSVVVTGDVLRLGGFGADSQVQDTHTYSTDHLVSRQISTEPTHFYIEF